MEPGNFPERASEKLCGTRGRARVQHCCCSCTAQRDGKKRYCIGRLELQVCRGAELRDIFMLVQVCGRCLMAQGISMSMKNYRSTIRKSPSETRLSSTRAVVVTVEPLRRQSERPSALRIKGGIGIWSIFKFCIFGLAQSTGMVPSNVTYVSLFIAHMSPGGWEYSLI